MCKVRLVPASQCRDQLTLLEISLLVETLKAMHISFRRTIVFISGMAPRGSQAVRSKVRQDHKVRPDHKASKVLGRSRC